MEEKYATSKFLQLLHDRLPLVVQRKEKDKQLVSVMAIEDIKRHQHSINQCSARKYPGASFQVAVYILDYIKSPVFPDVQIEMIPMEGPEWVPWSRYIPKHTLDDIEERKRSGKKLSLIFVKAGLKYPTPELFIINGSILEDDRPWSPIDRSVHDYRTVAFDPDGTRLECRYDPSECVLREVEYYRSKENRWSCLLEDEETGRVEDKDIFEAANKIYYRVSGYWDHKTQISGE